MFGEPEEQRGEPGLPGDSAGWQRSVRQRHPIGRQNQHRPLSGAQGCKGAHDKRSASSAPHRSSGNSGAGAVALRPPRPHPQPCPAQRGLSGLAAEGSRSPAPWAGRAMPCGSSSKGTVCCHTSSTAEGAQGGPRAGEGPAWVPGRSPLPKLRCGDSATQRRRVSSPCEVQELLPGPPSAPPGSAVFRRPLSFPEGSSRVPVHRRGTEAGRSTGPGTSTVPLSPWTGPRQVPAASNWPEKPHAKGLSSLDLLEVQARHTPARPLSLSPHSVPQTPTDCHLTWTGVHLCRASGLYILLYWTCSG